MIALRNIICFLFLLGATLINCIAFAADFAYDDLNRLTQVTYPSGTTINYTYDAGGNITQIVSVPAEADTTPPASPTQIEAIDLGVGEILLSWITPLDDDFSHIKIYRSTESGQLGATLVDNVSGISFVDSSVREKTVYFFTVRSVDTVGNESTNTAQVSVAIGDLAPGVPSGVTAVVTVANATNGGEVDLGWINPLDSDFACTNIYRSDSIGVLGVLAADCVPGTSVTDTGMTNGVTYYFTVRAEDAGGNQSTNTGQVSATPTHTGDDTPAGDVTASITDPNNGEFLTLNWAAPTDVDVAYVVIYRSTDGSLGELVHGVVSEPNAVANWIDPDVTASTTYHYTFKSIDTSGNESAGVQLSELVNDNVLPRPVVGLKLALLAGGVLQLDWNESGSGDAAYYNVYWDNGSGTVDTTRGNELASVADPTTTLTTAILTAGTTYRFIVRTEDASQNEETNSIIVAGVPINDPNAGGVCSYIKVPQTGHNVGGNSVTVLADLSCGILANVRDVTLQYKPATSGSWTDIPTNDTNPATTVPYFIHWDVDAGCPTSCIYPDGDYLLRAVGTNTSSLTDPDPGYITITIDHNNPESSENNNAGKQSKQDPAYQSAPSTSSMGDDDGVTRIEVPAESLDEDTTVVIEDVETPPLAPAADYDDAGSYKDIHFGNGQGQLNNDKKAKVTLSYKDDDGDGIVDGSDPPISVYDLQLCNDHANTWTCLNSTVDKANKQVKGLVDKFSTFGLLVPPRLAANGDWDMVAIPFTPVPNSASIVLGGLNQYGGSWIQWWEPTGQSFIRVSTIEPGKSYFILGNGGQLKVTGTETPQQNFTVNLKKGWNQLGNPFRYQVDLADLSVTYNSQTVSLQQAQTNGWVIGTIWTYANGAYQVESVQDGGKLPIWDGFWMLSDVDCQLTIPPDPSE